MSLLPEPCSEERLSELLADASTGTWGGDCDLVPEECSECRLTAGEVVWLVTEARVAAGLGAELEQARRDLAAMRSDRDRMPLCSGCLEDNPEAEADGHYLAQCESCGLELS